MAGGGMSAGLAALTGAAAVGSAIVGGVFYAFSTFVMPAFRRLPTQHGVAAMQAINVAAVRPGLMIALFGTAGACAAVTVWAGVTWQTRRSLLLIAGSACYLVGAVGITAAYHVPLNNRLAAYELPDPQLEQVWQHYLRSWSAGNHLRAAGCLAAAALFSWALTTDHTESG
jgi:uncharacterized membrane protein